MTDEDRPEGWYGTSRRSHVARHWDGKVWSRPVPRHEFGRGVVIHVDPDAEPRNAPRRKPKIEIGAGAGCLLVLVGLVVVALFISWISSPFQASNNPKLTEQSGLATCKELVAKQDGGSGNTTVQGSVLAGTTYKATIAVAGMSEAHRFTCRLEWTGSKWTRDVLEGHRM